MTTLVEARRRIQSREVSSRELVAAAHAAADRADAQLGVFLARFDEAALSAADEADRATASGESLGPLHGLPIAIKDIIETRESATTAQSRVHPRTQPFDADVVARLRAAGAVIVGKTTTMEYAHGLPDRGGPFPIPRNPWDLTRWAGGSSSGSASGVASGMFLAAVGTDTGGSIRIPAAYCGVTGLMPTYGQISMHGVLPLAFSLDHVGAIAASAADCELMCSVMAGPAGVGKTTTIEHVGEGRGLRGLRVGVCAPASDVGTDPTLVDRFDAAMRELEEAGAETIEVGLPMEADVLAAGSIVAEGEALAYHLPCASRLFSEYAPSTRASLIRHTFFSAADYVRAQRVRAEAVARLQDLWARVDVIASLSVLSTAPELDQLGDDLVRWGSTLRTGYWNAVGCPSISLPSGTAGDGLPCAFQLSAAPDQEAVLLRVATEYQTRTDWHLRRPS